MTSRRKELRLHGSQKEAGQVQGPQYTELSCQEGKCGQETTEKTANGPDALRSFKRVCAVGWGEG